MGAEATSYIKNVDNLRGKALIGKDVLPYFKAPFSVYPCEAYLLMLKDLLKKATPAVIQSQPAPTVEDYSKTLSYLKLL